MGDSHDRSLYVSTLSRLAGQDAAATSQGAGIHTHERHVGGIYILQEYEMYLDNLYTRAKYLLDPPYVPFQGNNQNLDYLEKVDTVIFDFRAWAAAGFNHGAMWTTQGHIDHITAIFWALAEVRHRRRKLFKETGYGYPDLIIIWVGSVPWPDKYMPDMRTNTRLQYWDDLANTEIEKINRHYQDEGGMIDHLNVYVNFPLSESSA